MRMEAIDRQLDRARRGELEALSSLYRTHSFYKGGNHALKASSVVAENTNSSAGWECCPGGGDATDLGSISVAQG